MAQHTEVDHVKLRPYMGARISRVVWEAFALALEEDRVVEFTFNDTECRIDPHYWIGVLTAEVYDAKRRLKSNEGI